jgi:hypothetical protein
MYAETLFVACIELTNLGIAPSTETLLDLRQRERDRGNDTKTYL